MHEYSLIQSLLDRVEQEATAKKATAVRRLWVRLGTQSGVERDLFAAAFDVCRIATICEGAELKIETVDAQWECRVCGRRVGKGELLTCPDCGAAAKLVAGDELFLDRIEMEVA
ncbi:MAG TPA: hydrogenase maturation nickel metallochaperone HypA [Verrucomicrobiae bacterium]|nr:hydrogenase maturation nickel metallochaperone HypA [Verrucomicrobiae bacterium]